MKTTSKNKDDEDDLGPPNDQPGIGEHLVPQGRHLTTAAVTPFTFAWAYIGELHKGCQYLMKNATKGLEDPPSCKCKMPQSSFSSTALMEMVMMLTMERRPTWQLPLPRRPWLGGPWAGGRATQYHRRRTQMLETVSPTFLFVWVLIVVSLCCGRHCHKQIRRLTLLFYCVHMFKTFADRAEIKRSNFCEHRSSFLC